VTRKHRLTPESKRYRDRFYVEDLAPEISPKRVKAIFIGESPHRDEVAPEDAAERSPFRGVAGREWWTELAKFLSYDVQTKPVPERAVLMKMASELGIVVMNAVQYPLDPKITLHQEGSSPEEQLGFQKSTGPTGYKKVYKALGEKSPVARAIGDLAERLSVYEDSGAQIVSMGGDSRWFTDLALAKLPEGSALRSKPVLQIPHPSSWWRNAIYRARAVATLEELLKAKPASSKSGLRRSSAPARRENLA
jgi:hypothetical protein